MRPVSASPKPVASTVSPDAPGSRSGSMSKPAPAGSDDVVRALLKELFTPTMSRTRRFLMIRHHSRENINHLRRLGHFCDIVLRGIAQVSCSLLERVSSTDRDLVDKSWFVGCVA